MNTQQLPHPKGDILIVDDMAANLRLLSRMLTDQGYKVRAVTSGSRALAAAHAICPDLVLLDIRMPEMDGYAVCSSLKANDETRDIPIIFISALNEADDKVNAFHAGGVDYITKPFQFAEVLARVETHLTLRRTQQQLRRANQALEERLDELDQANLVLQQEIKQRRLAEELERQRTQELEALRTTMTEISSELDLTRLLRAILERAVALIGATDGELSLYDEGRNDLRILTTYNVRQDYGMGWPVIEPASADMVITSREPLIINGYHNSVGHSPGMPTAVPHAVLLVPLLAGARFIGVIGIGDTNPERTFTPNNAELLKLFAQQATIAIQNAQLFSEIQTLATTDPLTGLFNRRHFFELAHHEVERARRTHYPVSVVMLDVDHFKLVNDQYGHQMGDQVLQTVAAGCRKFLRAGDVLGRYGGEEFVILLPDTTLDQAAQVAERLRQNLAMMKIASVDESITVTISLGIATLDAVDSEPGLDTLLSHADQALYTAKQSGRNQVARWQEVMQACSYPSA
jgi:diguanylate cyclase (GGDEF)-like protein